MKPRIALLGIAVLIAASKLDPDDTYGLMAATGQP
jgi:hypothetical protein